MHKPSSDGNMPGPRHNQVDIHKTSSGNLVKLGLVMINLILIVNFWKIMIN